MYTTVSAPAPVALNPQQERVTLRRSLNAPANARKNKLPTQAFLRAAEFGDFPAVRAMALEANAELSGLRCKNFLDCDPHHLVDSGHHMTNTEKKNLKYQFTELPEVINAIGRVHAAPKLAHSASTSLEMPRGPRPETPPLAKTKGITGRLARSENNLTRLATTIQARHHVCEAAKGQPQVMWERARTGEEALPAFARVLKSERLAVKATQMNPKLLRFSEAQIRKVMPSLVSICGSAEQAAYAVVYKPDLLELEGPAGLRDSLEAVSGLFGNKNDAMFLLGQTTAPPSVKVIARQFCREYMVGEYFLVDGGQVDDRPVWCKPAAAMNNLGSRARDVYLVYCLKGVVGSDTLHPCWTFTTSYSRSLKKYDHCDPNILGWAESLSKSPDQVDPGQWHFPAEAQKTQVPGLWPADPYVRCEDGGRERSPWLCTHAPQNLRDTFDGLKLATGLVWQPDEPVEGVQVLGHLVKNDPVFSGSSKVTFLEFAEFAHIRRWIFLQVPASIPSSTVVKLYAWEPIEVCMLFSHEELEANQLELLQKSDFRLMPKDYVKSSMPALQGAELSDGVWSRTFTSGPFQLQVPCSPSGMPALIFIRAHISAHVLGTQPCHMVKPLAGDEVYLPEMEESTDMSSTLDSTVLPRPKPVMYSFVSPGELGYTGYSLFKGPPSSQNASNVQMRVESMEELSIAMLLFPLPKVEVDMLEEEPPPPPKDAKKRNSKSSRKPSNSSQTSNSKESKESKESRESKIESKDEAPAPVPTWVDLCGWQALPQKLLASIQSGEGKKITCAHVYTLTLPPGQVLQVPSCGPDFFALFLFKQLSPQRPDFLRRLIIREPALLTAGENLDFFVSLLRKELGDLEARRVLMKDLETVVPPGTTTTWTRTIWPKLCQKGSAAQITTWVYDRKVEVLAQETTPQIAKSVLSSLGGESAAIAAHEIQDRCATLRGLLKSDLGQMLCRLPDLLRFDSAVLRGCFRIIEDFLGSEAALKACLENLKLLTLQEELVHFFELISEKFSRSDMLQLHEKAAREWIKWPSIVGKPDEEIHTWQGRVFSLYREGRCRQRVGDFGAAAYGAAALAQSSGQIPEIPPLLA